VPITTTDLDIVHRRTPENVARLLEVLLKLDATMRYDMAREDFGQPRRCLPGEGRSTSPRRWDRSKHGAEFPSWGAKFRAKSRAHDLQ
jgi:hypothetical protein